MPEKELRPIRVPEALTFIERWSRTSPDATAILSTDGSSLSYKEFEALTAAVGRKVLDAGIGAEETVAVLAGQGPLQLIAVAGVMRVCSCAVLQPRTIVSEVRESLVRLAASALVVSPEFEEEAQAASALGLAVVFARADYSPQEWPIWTLNPGKKPTVRHSDAVLYLMTSATTGVSKIVPLSAANLDAGVSARYRTLRLTCEDRQLLMTSFSHIIGVENTLAQFLAGGSVIATAGFDPNAYSSWLERLRPTWYDCAPAVHEAVLAQLTAAPPQSPTSLRFIQSAGSALQPSTKRALQDILRVPVFNDYGMTEACPIAVDAYCDEPIPEKSAGRSCGLEVAVMATSGELLVAGNKGEIVVRGPALISGYLDDQQSDKEAFSNGWFRTGDAGWLDERGNVFLTGRLKEMINRGGEKISPAEVDAIFRLHPAVMEAAAFGVPHPTLGEDVACAVVLRSEANSAVTTAELTQFAAQHLARFKVPHRIFLVTQLPKGELGKIQRRQLTEQFGNAAVVASSPVAPTGTSLDEGAEDARYWIREIWSRILNREDIGADEDFFAAGGDSLGAINMLSEVDQYFGSTTSSFASDFVDDPTIGNLSAMLERDYAAAVKEGATSRMKVYPVTSEGAGRRIYCVPGVYEEGFYFRRLAKHLRGKMDLSIVRPANLLNDLSLYAFERAAEQVTELIQSQQKDGVCLIGGFCWGGVIASEVARRLKASNRDVRLVLFDAQMPGYPGVWNYLGNWIRSGLRTAGTAFEDRRPLANSRVPAESGENSLPRGSLYQLVQRINRSLRGRSLRLLWYAANCNRALLARFQNTSLAQWTIKKSLEEYFGFFTPQRILSPILHFRCVIERDRFETASRLGWRKYACKGIEERVYTVNDHHQLFRESHLPQICETILHWIVVTDTPAQPH